MADGDLRPACKYGRKCYRRNPEHLKQFYHRSELTPRATVKTIMKRKSDVSDDDDVDSKRSRQQDDEVDHKSTHSSEGHSSCEESEMPESPSDIRESIKQKFLVDMPDDFYSFWDFCKSVNASQPKEALSSLSLRLVGPYDVLDGTLKANKFRKLPAYLTHCRYYYDPPEFQTVVAGIDAEMQFHLGYFRDSPDEPPVFVAENEASKDCTFKPIGENLFAAVNSIIDKQLTTEENNDVSKLQSALHAWAKKCKCSLEPETTKMKARKKKVVTKSFHGAGIVVPLKSDIGYRPLPDSDANLRKLLKRIIDCKTDELREKQFDSLQHIINLIQFANDECDYGMGLELALDLFSFGDPYFHRTIENLLPLAYELLERPQFAQIAKAHLASRTKNLLL